MVYNALQASGCGPVGRALDLGSRCREFESPHSDQRVSEINDFRDPFSSFTVQIFSLSCLTHLSAKSRPIIIAVYHFSSTSDEIDSMEPCSSNRNIGETF